MIFSLQFKTPDVTDQLAMNDKDLQKAKKLIEQFVRYNEYIIVRFDTDTNTCEVVKYN